MKRGILIILVLLGLALAAIYIFIPRHLKISQVIRIGANKEGLYRKLSNAADWSQWWPGNKTPDASGAWEMEGNLYFPSAPRMISIPFTIKKGKQESGAELTFLAINPDSTLLHLETSIDASNNPVQRVQSYFRAVKIKNQFVQILQSLSKNYSTVISLYHYPIEKKLVVDSNLVFTAVEVKGQPDYQLVYSMAAKLSRYISAMKAKETGLPMLNIFTQDSLNYLVKVALPTDRRLPDAGDIHYRWMLGGGNILITEVKGGPEEIRKAYIDIHNYITDYKRVAPAIPFESLVTNRLEEKDSSKWVTRIYYPVM
jgi:hypothetical protein